MNKNTGPRIGGTLAVLLCLHGVASASDSAAVAARIARVETCLRYPVAIKGEPARTMTLVDRMKAWHVPGVSVAVINDGAIEWSRAYGIADASSGKPLTASSLMQAASISKLITSAAALRLVEDGKLRLDEDVNVRLRSWKVPVNALTAGHPVTLSNLLSHTAGMPDAGLRGYPEGRPLPSLLQALDGLAPATTAPVRVLHRPGERYRYSSAGYAVLQQLMEDVTGSTFAAAVGGLVFEPLAMRNSFFSQPLADQFQARAASGHDLNGEPLAGGSNRYPELAAAGLWTTPTDLARFVIALQRSAARLPDSFLHAPTSDTMLTEVLGGYGLGVELEHAGSARTLAHSGSNEGFKTMLFAYTALGQGAVIMTNGDYGTPLIQEIMRSIAAEYGWHDYLQAERTRASLPSARYAAFAGEFQVSGTSIKVTREGDRLFLAGPPLGPDRLELLPESDYVYFMREKVATVTFKQAGSEPVTELVFDDGRARRGVRITPRAAD